MSGERRDAPRSLSAVEAGKVLDLPPDVVRALSDAGYLTTALQRGVPHYGLSDVKAFQAKLTPDQDIDPQVLLALLDGRSEEMAQRSLSLLQAFVPDTIEMPEHRQQRFLDEARARIDAILTVCAHGERDEELEREMAETGADAAHRGVPLPAVLVGLRVTRDLVVQTAVDVAEGIALAVALTRVIPVIDKLSDAVARGYWEAVLDIEAEHIDRFRTIVDRAADGVFTIAADGTIDYANGSLATLLGKPVNGIVGRQVRDVVGIGAGETGVVGILFVRQFERLRDGVVAGWDGLVRVDQGRFSGSQDAAAAPGVVDGRDRVGHDDLGDRPERVGGGATSEGDGVAGIAAEGDGGLERDPTE
jgi:PAS domain-containing protein